MEIWQGYRSGKRKEKIIKENRKTEATIVVEGRVDIRDFASVISAVEQKASFVPTKGLAVRAAFAILAKIYITNERAPRFETLSDAYTFLHSRGYAFGRAGEERPGVIKALQDEAISMDFEAEDKFDEIGKKVAEQLKKGDNK